MRVVKNEELDRRDPFHGRDRRHAPPPAASPDIFDA